MKIIVGHSEYGCDTGCCGHVVNVELADGEIAPLPLGSEAWTFTFNHPLYDEDKRKWAEDLVRDSCGADHVRDLAWDECLVLDD
jgi:hypothetical protein